MIPKHIIYIIAHQEGNHGTYVVHRQMLGYYGGETLERNFMTGKTLREYRKELRAKGLTFEDRKFGDDPKIVEKWI